MSKRRVKVEETATRQDHLVTVDTVAIRQQLEELKRMQRTLEEILAGTEPTAGSQKPGTLKSRAGAIPNGIERSTTETMRGRPLRAVILDALQDLGWPAYSRELALYCQARYGRKIAATRFGTLAADEEKAYLRPSRRPQSLWLCFALTFDRHQPIKRLMARSDWPLPTRIVAPTTGRVQHLWMTRRICDLALEIEQSAADPDMLKIIAADHARDVLDVKVRRGEFDLMGWREAADAQLSELLPEDERLREEAAQRLAARPERVQLFGIPDVIEGGRIDRPTMRGEA